MVGFFCRINEWKSDVLGLNLELRQYGIAKGLRCDAGAI
jgi:hypothetical protein